MYGYACYTGRSRCVEQLQRFDDLLVSTTTVFRMELNSHRRPVKPLLFLRTPANQRWGFVLLLSVSLLPCIAGLLRLYYLEAFYDSIDELCKSIDESVTCG